MPGTPQNPSQRRGTRMDEAGGHVVQVLIIENGAVKYTRTASLTGSPNGPIRRYTTDDGDVINHNINTGVKELGKKILNK